MVEVHGFTSSGVASSGAKIALKKHTEEQGTHIPGWSGRQFTVLGDSIVSSGAHMWDLVQDRLGLGDYRNFGVWGAPMADGTSKGDGTVTTACSQIYPEDKMVYIAAGTNDLTQNVPLGSIGSWTQTSFDRTTFYGAYRSTIDFILGNNPGIRIFLATPLQRNAHGYTIDTANSIGLKLQDYRNAVKAVGELYSIPVIDMYAISGLTRLTLGFYTVDGLHPNEAGFEQLSRVAVAQIRTTA